MKGLHEEDDLSPGAAAAKRAPPASHLAHMEGTLAGVRALAETLRNRVPSAVSTEALALTRMVQFSWRLPLGGGHRQEQIFALKVLAETLPPPNL